MGCLVFKGKDGEEDLGCQLIFHPDEKCVSRTVQTLSYARPPSPPGAVAATGKESKSWKPHLSQTNSGSLLPIYQAVNS